jgi:hypothetical protein
VNPSQTFQQKDTACVRGVAWQGVDGGAIEIDFCWRRQTGHEFVWTERQKYCLKVRAPCWKTKVCNEMEWGQINWLIDEGVDLWIYTQGKGV